MFDIIVKSKDLPESILNFQELMCGCGCPFECWQWLLNYLEKVEKKSNRQFDITNGAEGLGAYVIHTQCKMTTHGGNIGCSWLTDEGKIALEWLREKGLEYADDMIIDFSNDWGS